VASDRQRNFEFLIDLSIIYKTIKSSASTTGGNFDEFEILVLNFGDRTRTGVFNMVWPLAFEAVARLNNI
jgi:hypothetical protein